ncbi:MAG: translation initiation factor IF-3 [Bdellovibrionia bacterium]
MKKKNEKDGLRVNREIRAAQIRVIDEEGNMLGVMTPNEGVRLAEERGLDLLEIAPTATPPTCKIMDYGKWKYENKKKAAAARKKQAVVTVKELQMRPRTDQHDFETKMKHARRFILDGDKVKITIRFLGREMAHQEIGMELLKRCIEFVKEISIIEAAPKMEGKNLFLLIGPDPVKIKDYLKANPSKGGKEEVLPELKEENFDEDED